MLLDRRNNLDLPMASRAQSRFLSNVAAALTRLRIGARDLVLIGVSGGRDSVALLHSLVALRDTFGYRVLAAHLNHGLRGDESDRDESFVRDLCRRLDVD